MRDRPCARYLTILTKEILYQAFQLIIAKGGLYLIYYSVTATKETDRAIANQRKDATIQETMRQSSILLPKRPPKATGSTARQLSGNKLLQITLETVAIKRFKVQIISSTY